MKKSDLKTGMIVETREGKNFVVFLELSTLLGTGRNVLVNNGGWDDLGYYSESLSSGAVERLDIVKVYDCKNICAIIDLFDNFDASIDNNYELIWERDDKEYQKNKEIEKRIKELETELNNLKSTFYGEK